MIPRVLGRDAGRWLDSRLRLAKVTRKTVAKVFPDHWSFMLGEIALYAFVVLVVTGVYLTLFFVPDTAERVYHGSYPPLDGARVSAAYASTVELSWDVPGGLLIRQTHHWAALVFIGAIVLHLVRIFFTAAFRKPREVNWLVGLTMLLLAILNGFAGYSLPDDLLSGTGLRIAFSVVESIPLIGGWLAVQAFGGEFPSAALVPRLYALHILLVPALLAALMGLHMAVLVRQKHTQFPGPGRRDSNVVGSRLWPTYAFRSVALLCGVAGVCFGLGGLAQINPVWIWGPFGAGDVTSPAQPDWYVAWVDGALRLFPPWEFRVFGYLVPSVFWPAVVLPAATFAVLYSWPWIDRRLTGDGVRHHVLQRPREQPFRVAVGVWAIWFYGLLLAAGGEDVAARYLKLPILGVIWTMRVAVLVLPLVAAAVGYRVARRLRLSGAEHLGTLELPRLPSPTGRPSAPAPPEHLPIGAGDAPEAAMGAGEER